MPLYTYADWVTQTSVDARLTRLRLHIVEVTEKLNIEIAADGKSRSSNAIQQYLDRLLSKETELESRSGRISTGVTRVRVCKPGRSADASP